MHATQTTVANCECGCHAHQEVANCVNVWMVISHECNDLVRWHAIVQIVDALSLPHLLNYVHSRTSWYPQQMIFLHLSLNYYCCYCWYHWQKYLLYHKNHHVNYSPTHSSIIYLLHMFLFHSHTSHVTGHVRNIGYTPHHHVKCKNQVVVFTLVHCYIASRQSLQHPVPYVPTLSTYFLHRHRYW